jgi:Fic family protein
MDMSKKMTHKLEFSGSSYRKIMQQLSIIDSFKGNWKAIENQQSKHLKELRKIATIESIGSSTRIEGSTLTNKEVEKLLKTVKITNLKTRDEQEVLGYYKTLQVILENYTEIKLSERYIHQLHGLLLKFSGKDQHHKGKYKTLSNQVVANYPDGTKKTIFKTSDPSLTATEMQEAIEWTNDCFKRKNSHPVIIIATFIYEFLSIHPYQDGNGRLSRLLTTLLMMQQEYEFIQYVSFENIIEAKKKEYYRTLMEGQKNRGNKDEKIDKWILFFLDCMISMIERLEAKYQTYNKLSKELNQRQKKILQYVKKQKKVQISEVENMFKDFSRNTLKKDLAYFVNEGLLIKTGLKKGVKYHYHI